MDQPILHDSKHLPCWSVLEQDTKSLPAPEKRATLQIIICLPPSGWRHAQHKFGNKYSHLVIVIFKMIINNNDDTLTPYSSVTHHIDGIYWADAVDKHVCVDHCWFDCKEAQKKSILEMSNDLSCTCTGFRKLFISLVHIIIIDIIMIIIINDKRRELISLLWMCE